MRAARYFSYLCLMFLASPWLAEPALADCSDATYWCFTGDIRIEPDVRVRQCWQWLPPKCSSCNGRSLREQAAEKCNQRHEDDCRGNCTATPKPFRWGRLREERHEALG